MESIRHLHSRALLKLSHIFHPNPFQREHTGSSSQFGESPSAFKFVPLPHLKVYALKNEHVSKDKDKARPLALKGEVIS